MGKKNLARAGGFLLLFAMVWSALTAVLVPARGINRRSETEQSVYHFDRLEKNTIDMLVLGASTAWSSIFPAVVWAQCGLTGYNYAGNGQPPIMLYHSLLYALQTQAPAVLVLDTAPLFYPSLADGDGKHESFIQRRMDAMRLTPAKARAALDLGRQSGALDTAALLLPLLRYHARWEALTPQDLCPEAGAYAPCWMGSYASGHAVRVIPFTGLVGAEDAMAVPPEESVAYYEGMLEACRARGIEVVLYRAPRAASTWAEHNYLASFSRRQGVAFLDMNEAGILTALRLDFKADYYNADHVNRYGGEKTSRFLGQYLRETLGLADRRQDPGTAALWDGYAEAFRHFP